MAIWKDFKTNRNRETVARNADILQIIQLL